MKKQTITGYREAVEYLYQVPRFTKKSTMEDTKRFLLALGNPEQNFKIIHVAGTNGKGSVCAYLRGILTEAGFSCGVFTSPHLVECRERFAIGCEMVSEEIFTHAFLTIYEKLDWDLLEKGEGYHPTFFEFLFFMGMVIFTEAKVDYCILETGLGGRLDATNAVSRKEISVITRIGRDHMEYLGDTLTQIAGEKAGIIMENVPVVYAAEVPEATEKICQVLSKKNALGYPVSENDYALLKFKNKTIDFSYHSRYYDYISVRLHTIAKYQMENCALAIRTVEVLDKERQISVEQILAGVEKTFWAGRMEEVSRDFYVDGAHNTDGIRAFLETVSQDGFTGTRTLLFGVVSDKEYEDMIAMIGDRNLFGRICVVQLQGARATKVQEIAEIWRQDTGLDIEIFSAVWDAVEGLLATQKPDERIYGAGSLYLVGEIKGVLERCRHDQL